MGLYYTAPLLGPSLGPILGGALAQVWSWRATFWFLAVCIGIAFLSFLFFHETFRKERSLTYQAILSRIQKEQAATAEKRHNSRKDDCVHSHQANNDDNDEHAEKDAGTPTDEILDVEAQNYTYQSLKDAKLSLTDVNPVVPIFGILRRMNNIVILLASGTHILMASYILRLRSMFLGVLFAFSYCVPYTCSLTLATKYGYNALEIGLVLLSLGIGKHMKWRVFFLEESSLLVLEISPLTLTCSCLSFSRRKHLWERYRRPVL
jgi:MFS family permease